MGALGSFFCRRETPIVPDYDPLTGPIKGRIVRAEVSKDFDITTTVLGTGYSGAVYLAEHRITKQQVAVKQFRKRSLRQHQVELLRSEVGVYLKLDHPNVCRLLYAYEGKKYVCLVMELCACELYTRVCEKKIYRESDAADVMLQTLQAVSYLHGHNIVHRDLKLENWMYAASDSDDRIKLIDFGFSRCLGRADETLEQPCGSLHYASPEVLSRKYTSKCDLWSLGVICYMLLMGRPPFRGKYNVVIARAIMKENFPQDGRWKTLSSHAQDFITLLLDKDAASRPEANVAMQHAWITGHGTNELHRYSEIGRDTLCSLRQFTRGSHLRRVALTVMAYSLTSNEIKDVEQRFLAFDKSGRGTITLAELAETMNDYLEVSSSEAQRIFQSLDTTDSQEVHYTPFVAAMLATRVQLYEDKVREAFAVFDQEGTGYITKESLSKFYSDACSNKFGVTPEAAEQWINEVDYKGNGCIDYDDFLAALLGKKLWASTLLGGLGDDSNPKVRVFEESRSRSHSDSDFESDRSSRTSDLRSLDLRYEIVGAIIDGDVEEQRGKTVPAFASFANRDDDSVVQVRNLRCDVDENYFK